MKEVASKILLSIGGTVLGITYMNLEELDLVMAIGLKFTGFVSFVIYLVLNWRKLMDKIKGK